MEQSLREQQILDSKQKIEKEITSHKRFLLEHEKKTNELNELKRKLDETSLLCEQKLNQLADTHYPSQKLHFHTKYKDLFELKQWINGLSDEMIIDNHLIAAEHTKINQECEDVSSCGNTSQGLMNMFLERNGHSITQMVFNHIWDRKMLADHNIIYVGMDHCTCCCFPGHAFIIYCSHDKCYIIQSFIKQYTIKDFFDLMDFDKVDKYMNIFADMITHGITDRTIKKLKKFTHTQHGIGVSGCKMKDSRFDVYCYENKHGFNINNHEKSHL